MELLTTWQRLAKIPIGSNQFLLEHTENAYREWQKVASSIASGWRDRGEDISIVHSDDHRSVRKPGDLAGLNGDGAGSDLEILPEGLENLPARRRSRRLLRSRGSAIQSPGVAEGAQFWGRAAPRTDASGQRGRQERNRLRSPEKCCHRRHGGCQSQARRVSERRVEERVKV